VLGRIYKRGPLTWPRLLQVDPGREFLGAFTQLLAKHNVQVRRGAALPTTTASKGSWNGLTGLWQNDYSDTNMLRRCCLLYVGLLTDLSKIA